MCHGELGDVAPRTDNGPRLSKALHQCGIRTGRFVRRTLRPCGNGLALQSEGLLDADRNARPRSAWWRINRPIDTRVQAIGGSVQHRLHVVDALLVRTQHVGDGEVAHIPRCR